MKNIQELNINILHPHPNNPRKDLGDLTELAESIKQSGVMQNLTVVPHKEIKGEYTVIIGHRRLGASKLAGIDKVPCVIVEMSDKEQLATMMLENMQRSDLTTYEQAEGFQMMIDLGETIEEISEQTGLSKTTVRNRVKLSKYDKEVMREAATRQPTMTQYMKLCEIEDLELANNVARFLGTANFDAEVSKALRIQKEAKQKAEMIAFVKSIAEKYDGVIYEAVQDKKIISVQSLYLPLKDEDKEKALENKKKYNNLFYSEGYGITLFRKFIVGEDDQPTEYDINRQIRIAFENRAKQIYEDLRERAEQFVAEYPGRKSDLSILTRYLAEACIHSKWGGKHRSKGIATALGWNCPEGIPIYSDRASLIAEMFISDRIAENEAKTLLNIIFHGYEKSNPGTVYYRDKKLNYEAEGGGWGVILSLLSELGYNVSEDEWRYVRGEHPIYSEEIPL